MAGPDRRRSPAVPLIPWRGAHGLQRALRQAYTGTAPISGGAERLNCSSMKMKPGWRRHGCESPWRASLDVIRLQDKDGAFQAHGAWSDW